MSQALRLFLATGVCFSLLTLSACKDSLPSLLPTPPDRVKLSIDAPASGVFWREKKINCKDKETGICQDLGLLLQQLDFPKRSQTLASALDEDYRALKEKARFSNNYKSNKKSTSLPPKRGDSYSFPVTGSELTVIIEGSGAGVNVTLTSPDGSSYNSDSPNIDHEKTAYLERFIIPEPSQGMWTLSAFNNSGTKPVYAITFEAFVTAQKVKTEGVRISAEVLDDGEVVFSVKDSSSAADTLYEWDLGDGFAGQGAVIGHNYSPGKYIPQLIILEEGMGEAVIDAPFFVRKRPQELPEIIEINNSGKKLPSPPKILSAKKEGSEVAIRSLAGESNGSDGKLKYQYSLDEGSSWQEVDIGKGIFSLPYQEGMRLTFRSLNDRGAGAKSLLLCNFSGYYPLEAKARGIVEGERINLYLRSGGCPGERWNIIAPLWKEVGIF